MKTLVLRSFFIWVLSSILIHAMVVPIDFSSGDHTVFLDVNASVVDSDVDSLLDDGVYLFVPSYYTDAYLATLLVEGEEVVVTAEYNSLEVEPSYAFSSSDYVVPGDEIELSFLITNLYGVSNTVLFEVSDSNFNVDFEDTILLSSLSSNTERYTFGVPSTINDGEYDLTFLLTDQYGVEYTDFFEIAVQRSEDDLVLADISFDACEGIVQYTVENLALSDVDDAIIRVDSGSSLLEYDYFSVGSNTGYGSYSGSLLTTVSDNFILRVYNPDGGKADYVHVSYGTCINSSLVEEVTETETIIESNSVAETDSVSSLDTSVQSVPVGTEFMDLSELEIALYVILGPIAIIVLWSFLLFLRNLLK